MKKTILITFISLCFYQAGISQINLVPNSSFEDHDTCPYYASQIEFATGWFSLTTSCDYYNSCATNSNWSVPNNMLGQQYPLILNCNSYSGIFAYTEPIYREYISTQLINPMEIGKKYFVSFYVSLADNSNCAVNNMGIVFSKALLPYTSTMFTNFLNYAHIYSTAVITDKINWTRIYGTFVADSNYNFLNIGVFFDNSNTDTVKFDNLSCNAYYYIDDVCVSTDTLACNPGIEICPTGIEKESSLNLITVNPNPFDLKTTISISKCQFHPDFKIYDLLGKDVTQQTSYHFENSEGKTTIEINKQNLKRGIYLIKIIFNNSFINSKLIIN